MTRIRLNTLLFTFALLTLFFSPPPPPEGSVSTRPPHSQFSLISTVQAATINVDSTCTITQAIASANGDTSSGSCETGSGADTINISGTHRITADLPIINTTITIIGSSNATIQSNGAADCFDIRSGANLTVRNLTITRCHAQFGNSFNIFTGTTTTIENSVIHNNRGDRVGGGTGTIDMEGGTTLTVRNSVFYNNDGSIAVGGGTLTIENSTFYNNNRSPRRTNHPEGLNMSAGTVTVTHATFVGNYRSINRTGGTLNLRNSIVIGDGTDCSGTLNTNAGNLIADNTCSPKVSGAPMLGAFNGRTLPLLEGSPAIDAAVSAHCLATDQRGVPRTSATCDIGAYEGFLSSPKKSEAAAAEEDDEPYVPPTPRPPTYTGETFFQQTGIRVSATHGLRSGVQFKRIGAANIGLPAVLNNGFIDAVDIFGYVEQGVEVCFPQSGALLFLDAATSPRTILPWPSTIVDSFTCGRVTRPGTLVLVPLGSPLAGPVSTPQPFPASQGQSNSTGQIALTDCFVTTTHILNLRESPGGDIIGRVNYNATLSAIGLDGSWYRIEVDGLSGWISADFARTRGNCA